MTGLCHEGEQVHTPAPESVRHGRTRGAGVLSLYLIVCDVWPACMGST